MLCSTTFSPKPYLWFPSFTWWVHVFHTTVIHGFILDIHSVCLSQVKRKIATSYLLLVLFALFVRLFSLVLYYPLTAPVLLHLYGTCHHSTDHLLCRFLRVIDCSVFNYSTVAILWVFSLESSLAVVHCEFYGGGGDEEGCVCDAFGSILGRSLGKVKAAGVHRQVWGAVCEVQINILLCIFVFYTIRFGFWFILFFSNWHKIIWIIRQVLCLLHQTFAR